MYSILIFAQTDTPLGKINSIDKVGIGFSMNTLEGQAERKRACIKYGVCAVPYISCCANAIQPFWYPEDVTYAWDLVFCDVTTNSPCLLMRFFSWKCCDFWESLTQSIQGIEWALWKAGHAWLSYNIEPKEWQCGIFWHIIMACSTLLQYIWGGSYHCLELGNMLHTQQAMPYY